MSADPPTDPALAADPADRMSSLVDGEALGEGLEQACRQWRQDPAARHQWHTYHLIGDVLRSEELATAPSRDEAFLQALRRRLADEPVVLAPMTARPAAVPEGLPRRAQARRWLMPAAAAAGVAAVGLSAMMLRPDTGGTTGWSEPVAAVQPGSAQSLRRTVGAPVGASSPAFVLDGQVIRDARLDAYFEAHRGAAGALPSAVPGGALRSVEILVPQR